MTQPTIDLAAFGELQSTAGAEFVCELVDTFLVEAPLMLDELRLAYASGNADTFRRTAHSLKSNSNTFGALTLGKLAKDLELGGMAPVREANGAPLEELEFEYARVAKALAELARA
ncbi:MAG TPA: Hpt domain-containing protein [Casimicrobiaceae bacterium]|nr:Hpt domain-containing protein [Casimicrobiaceae bacterium]